MAKLWYHGTKHPLIQVKPFFCVTPEKHAAAWYGNERGILSLTDAFFHIHSYHVSTGCNIVDEVFLIQSFRERFGVLPIFIPGGAFQNIFNIADDLAIRGVMIKKGIDAVLYSDYGPLHDKESGIKQVHDTLLVINKKILTLVDIEQVDIIKDFTC